MLGAAVVPHPPLLVPELGGAGGREAIAPLAAACDRVLADLIAAGPRTVVLVGPGESTATHDGTATGSLGGFGVLPDGDSAGGNTLPLSLTVGRRLLDAAGWTGEVVLQEVAPGTTAGEAGPLGRDLARTCGPDAVWLVLGDGTTRRGPRSPGHDDPRAPGFDASVAQALATGDAAALLGLDAGLAAELGAAGRPAWQVLAGAVTAAGWPAIEADLRYDDAPFGVGYLVALWRPQG